MSQAENPIPKPAPPVIGAPPPPPAPQPSSGRKFIALLLSLFLGLFLAGALISVVDDTCVLLFGNHFLTVTSATLAFLTLLAAALLYGLMGLTPLISKRVVLPVFVFMALSMMATFPVIIFYFSRTLQYDLLAACASVVFCLFLIRRLQGTWKFRWPLVADRHLGARTFSWRHLLVFLLVNLFLLLPAAVAYLGGCASLTLSRFSEGFVALHPGGIMVQARKYARADGKTILLFPMSHIADSDFYRSVRQTVASNSVVLLEGITDTQNLLTNRLSYQHAAKTLHLAQQHSDLDLEQGELIRADVDVQVFTPETIAALNLIALFYSEGLDAHTLALLEGFAPAPDLDQRLLDDLLQKRNAHLLEVLQEKLPQADSVIIPWGAAHMPGIARGIQKSGFHLVATRDYYSIRFGANKSGATGAGWVQSSETTR